MFSIGDFARLGQLSVRMLRHYDAIGLLRPAHVEPASGYRFYDADQLQRLNRVLALKDLGFTLSQVQEILDDKVNSEELRGMLRLRRAQLEAQLEADSARLARVEARLRMIETEGLMSTADVVLKQIAPVRIAELSAIAPSYESEDIGPVIGPLYGQLSQRMAAAGVVPAGPGVAYYEDTADASVVVHAGLAVTVAPTAEYDFQVVDLPMIPLAATIVHHGPMAGIGGTWQAIARWIEDNGYRTLGLSREVYLEAGSDDQTNWVTEIQQAVEKA